MNSIEKNKERLCLYFFDVIQCTKVVAKLSTGTKNSRKYREYQQWSDLGATPVDKMRVTHAQIISYQNLMKKMIVMYMYNVVRTCSFSNHLILDCLWCCGSKIVLII